ncbi:MAG: dienelactone hydrolase family protein [Zoogloeaceae bacterium]|jgi:carboxymethylenebutenolidase|nr:dienelactone hydrolase family protein [Zoogloeaceae bacterium]
MPRQTAKDFHPEVLKLFDSFVHGLIPRREFLKSAVKFAVAGVTAEVLLEALSPRFAEARQVEPDDKRIQSRYIECPSPNGYGKLRGLLAQPANVGSKLPTVLVVHENRGLNPHIEDIARRLALDNFIAFAPDALYPLGGYPGDEDKAREIFLKLDQTKTREDFVAAVGVLKHLPAGNGKVGVVGFCYGGGIANFLATRLPDLDAVVPFYGGQPSTEDVPNIKTPLLLHYAEHDERINAGWPPYEAALKKAGIKYEAYIYPGVQHGFNNDTTPRFDEAAAKLAWKRTLDFFNAHLRAGNDAAPAPTQGDGW